MYEEKNLDLSLHSELLIIVGHRRLTLIVIESLLYTGQLYRFIVGSGLCKDVKPGKRALN